MFYPEPVSGCTQRVRAESSGAEDLVVARPMCYRDGWRRGPRGCMQDRPSVMGVSLFLPCRRARYLPNARLRRCPRVASRCAAPAPSPCASSPGDVQRGSIDEHWAWRRSPPPLSSSTLPRFVYFIPSIKKRGKNARW